MNKMKFEKVTVAHQEILSSWLDQSHIQEFCDSTQSYKDDILNFISDRKELLNDCDGQHIYWISLDSGKPCAILMTIRETTSRSTSQLKISYLSKTGHTYSLDYMMGRSDHIDTTSDAKTLIEFIDFFRDEYDSKADIFLTNIVSENLRAKQVYNKVGFQYVTDFSSSREKVHQLFIKKFLPTVTLKPASITHYPMVQNMARFYVYDLSKECGHISDDWRLPEDGLFESFDFKNYFEKNTRKAYLIKVYDDVAGFILLNQDVTYKDSNWNVGEFFILGKYQKHGIGKISAEKIWEIHSGKWEVSVIPENISAFNFWKSTIQKFTANTFEVETKIIGFDKDQPKRIIFRFEN